MRECSERGVVRVAGRKEGNDLRAQEEVFVGLSGLLQ